MFLLQSFYLLFSDNNVLELAQTTTIMNAHSLLMEDFAVAQLVLLNWPMALLVTEMPNVFLDFVMELLVLLKDFQDANAQTIINAPVVLV